MFLQYAKVAFEMEVLFREKWDVAFSFWTTLHDSNNRQNPLKKIIVWVVFLWKSRNLWM